MLTPDIDRIAGDDKDRYRLANISAFLDLGPGQRCYDKVAHRRLVNGQITMPYYHELSLNQRINYRGSSLPVNLAIYSRPSAGRRSAPFRIPASIKKWIKDNMAPGLELKADAVYMYFGERGCFYRWLAANDLPAPAHDPRNGVFIFQGTDES